MFSFLSGLDVSTARHYLEAEKIAHTKKKKKNDRMVSAMVLNYQLFGFIPDYLMRTKEVNVSSMESRT